MNNCPDGTTCQNEDLIARLTAERDELRQEKLLLHDVVETLRDNNKLLGILDTLVDRLDACIGNIYYMHHPTCSTWCDDNSCDCGISDAMAAARAALVKP